MIGPQDLQKLNSLIDTNAPESENIETDYVIEQLDYDYVRECSDIRILSRLLTVLEYALFLGILLFRSGREGHYPHLEKVIKEKLVSLDPTLHSYELHHLLT